MARPGFRNHQKFRRLVKMLAISESHALGLCECLWSVAYENGNPVIGDSVAVELCAIWPFEDGRFTEAMLNCGNNGGAGLIEPVPDQPGLFQVHDLHDHCPDYVKARCNKEAERMKDKACGHCGGIYRSRDVRSLYCSDRCKVAAFRAKTKQPVTDETYRSVSETEGNGCNPTPAPAPAPKEKKAIDLPGFSRFWDAYPPCPRKVDRARCASAWLKNNLEPKTDAVLRGLEQWKRTEFLRDEGKFIPMVLTFLNNARWETPPPTGHQKGSQTQYFQGEP